MHTDDEIERIVETYSHTLLRLIMHHVHDLDAAQDIVQDVFIAYMKQDRAFHDREHEKAWLLRVAINRCKNYRKHWWQSKRSTWEDTSGEERQSQFYVLDEVKKLSFHQRNAIYLFYYEGMSIQQIAHLFLVKEGTVGSWLHRGKAKLKEQLKGVWDDEA